MNKEDSTKIKELIFNFSEIETMKVCEERKDTPLVGLESYDHYCSKQIAVSKKFTDEMLHFVQNGLAKIIGVLKSQGDRKTLNDLNRGAEKFFQSVLQQSETTPLKELFSPEKPLATVLGYSNELLEKIYQIGIHCYQNRQLSDASHILAIVNLLDPTHFSAWLSLGVVLEQEKKWEQGLEALKVASQLDINNPIPHLHEAICYSNLGRKQEADQEFATTQKLANAQPAVYAGMTTEIKREKEKLHHF